VVIALSLANPTWLTALAGTLAALLIIGLNVFLIADLFL
jgi:hypothetical protein